MPIDRNSEELIPLTKVPSHMPASGRKIGMGAVYRWTKKGVAGVKLETTYWGGTRYTSREALDRFNDAVTAAMTSSSHNETRSGKSASKQASARARRALEKGGAA